MNYELIKVLLERRNLSTKDLYNNIDYTEAGYYRMIKEETLKVSTLEKISAILKVNPCLFFKDSPMDEIASEPVVEYKPIRKNSKSELEDLLRFKIETLEATIKELKKSSS